MAEDGRTLAYQFHTDQDTKHFITGGQKKLKGIKKKKKGGKKTSGLYLKGRRKIEKNNLVKLI